jgi:hypothetical protein
VTKKVTLVLGTGIETFGATDDSEDFHSEPVAVPDHGPQPRRPKRPSATVYRLDPHNTYRPADDPYLASMHDDGAADDDRRFSRERDVARVLAKTARAHAPKLASRADKFIASVIDRELLPDARWIVKSLPPAGATRVLGQFLAVLRDEIGLIRKNRRNTKS